MTTQPKRHMLHEYQERAIAFMKAHKRCVLSVGCGLGKTASVLHWLADTMPATALIVAPKRVAEYTWKQEADKWEVGDVAAKMEVVKGDKRKRMKALDDEAHPYKVIGRDNLGDLFRTEGKSKVLLYHFDVVVIDELTSFKTIDSKRTKMAAAVAADAGRCVGMTGTFIANGAIDIFGQCATVGLYSFNDFYRWRSWYFEDAMAGSGLPFHKWRLLVPLEQVLHPIAYRIFTLDSADYLTIPEVSYIEHKVTLTDAEMRQYMSVDAFLECSLDGVGVSVGENAKFMKLQTMCDGFVYVGATDDIGGEFYKDVIRGERSTKLEEVAELCERCVNGNEPVLLFYAFREERKWLSEILEAKGVACMDVKDKGAIERWQSGEFVGVMTAHPASAGHGLNLQGGRIVVWSSVTYNYEYYIQANARLARQGQRKAVQVHIFTAADTIEERKVKALAAKDGMQNEFIELTKQ